MPSENSGIPLEGGKDVINVAEIQDGFLSRRNNFYSWNPRNMFAIVRPSGEPVATLSICFCILWSKLNSAEVVAAVIISVKNASEIVGETNSLL